MKVFLAVFALLVASASAAPGFQFGFPDGRIVGGVDANPHQFKYIVSLQLVSGTARPRHNCGGSILNENYVLTAAHCISSTRTQVVAGIHDLSADEASEQRVEIAQIFAHPLYPGGNAVAPHDVAVIRLATSLVFNEFVQPIALPARDTIHSGAVVLAGWGSTSSSWLPSFPNILQTIVKTIIDYDECERILGNSPLHPNNVCTGPVAGGTSVCSGDSGGPLATPGDNPVIVGIVSWGFVPCGSAGRPSVYGRVSAYIDWINEKMTA